MPVFPANFSRSIIGGSTDNILLVDDEFFDFGRSTNSADDFDDRVMPIPFDCIAKNLIILLSNNGSGSGSVNAKLILAKGRVNTGATLTDLEVIIPLENVFEQSIFINKINKISLKQGDLIALASFKSDIGNITLSGFSMELEVKEVN